jgi:hypothetical protein
MLLIDRYPYGLQSVTPTLVWAVLKKNVLAIWLFSWLILPGLFACFL